MYDELVKLLREVEKMLTTANFNEASSLISQAADAIEELQQIAAHYEETAKDYFKDVCYYLERVPNWIPVTERLPGTGEIVLVYGKRGGIYTAEHNRNARWPGSFWKMNSKSHHCEPTHWMPLPEPPKEET